MRQESSCYTFIRQLTSDMTLAELIGVFFPGFGSFTGFYLFVFLTGIALPGCFDKAGINNLTCLGKDRLVIKRLIETTEQGYNNFFLNKGFSKLSDGLAQVPGHLI